MIEPCARILAIETSGRWGSAAIGAPDAVVARAELPSAMRHAADFLPLIHGLLRDQNWPPSSLTHVFVSVGPGSFTGLRIGVTIARTLSWSIGARIVAVPTLDALALNALQHKPAPPHVAVLLDAKRGQVYAAAYRLEDDGCTRITGPVLEQPADFLARLPRPLAILGEGITYHRAAVDAARVETLPEPLWRPRAEQVFRLGLRLARCGLYSPGPDLLPLYIRRPEAQEKWEKLHPEIG
jgi:tRNA threonylcarbamoyladenosine biosynthesis protein TsaB